MGLSGEELEMLYCNSPFSSKSGVVNRPVFDRQNYCASLHDDETNMDHHSACIYIHAFGRHFYPKAHLKVHIL